MSEPGGIPFASEYEGFVEPLPNKIYHYCSVISLLGIATSRSIWLTSTDGANDYREVVHLRDNFDTALDSLKRPKYDNFVRRIRESIKFLSYTFFIASFSKRDDLLSQWRGYAEMGTGVAIGFDPQCFRASRDIPSPDSTGDEKAFLHAVTYSGDISESIAIGLAKSLEPYSPEVLNDPKLDISDTVKLVLGLTPMFKSDAFNEEQEWRLIYVPKVNQISRILPFIGLPEYEFKKFKFRVADGRILPYIEWSFSDARSTAIREVVIGPRSKLTVDDLRLFLRAAGYGNAQIRQSRIPLR